MGSAPSTIRRRMTIRIVDMVVPSLWLEFSLCDGDGQDSKFLEKCPGHNCLASQVGISNPGSGVGAPPYGLKSVALTDSPAKTSRVNSKPIPSGPSNFCPFAYLIF